MLQEIIDILVASFTALNQPLAEVVLQNQPTLNFITTDKGRICVFFYMYFLETMLLSSPPTVD